MFLVHPHYKCKLSTTNIHHLVLLLIISLRIHICGILSTYSIKILHCSWLLWFYKLLNTTIIIEILQKLNQGYSWWLTEGGTNIFKLSARIDVPCYNSPCTENYQDQRRCTWRLREVSVVLWNHSPILPTNYKTKPPILVVGHQCT